MRRFEIILLIGIFAIFSNPANACFILFLKDSNNFLVANHEDWFAKDGAIKINPPDQGKYGSIVFTFLSEGWAQGGMNEKGLFFDAARTPYQEIIFDNGKRDPVSYVWQEVLDKAATVSEALQLLSQYYLDELSEASVMMADASGQAVIIGVHNNRLDVRSLTGNYLIQTNFNHWHPELSAEPACTRYVLAENTVSGAPATLKTMLSVLQQTHQDSLTIYSNIYDLKNKTIYTYNKRDFTKPITTKLPEYFQFRDCILSLDSLAADKTTFETCRTKDLRAVLMQGVVTDDATGDPIPFVNIGLLEKNIGTLSDPDGSFELALPPSSKKDSVIFSAVGFETRKIRVSDLINFPSSRDVKLRERTILLDEVTISDKKLKTKVERLGWMGGKDGILPFDTVMGGGAVALLVESPGVPFYVEKLQVRLMYNSRDTLRLRFHIYEFDSVKQKPGKDLLTREIILYENKKFGWLRFDLSDEHIVVNQKKICIGFEWIDDRRTRKEMLDGLRKWEEWKKKQFEAGNEKVKFITSNAEVGGFYKYFGNMMDWPGFKNLPPFTGLMVETGKRNETHRLRTFERKTSFGQWTETVSTLNAVITIRY